MPVLLLLVGLGLRSAFSFVRRPTVQSIRLNKTIVWLVDQAIDRGSELHSEAQPSLHLLSAVSEYRCLGPWTAAILPHFLKTQETEDDEGLAAAWTGASRYGSKDKSP